MTVPQMLLDHTVSIGAEWKVNSNWVFVLYFCMVVASHSLSISISIEIFFFRFMAEVVVIKCGKFCASKI